MQILYYNQLPSTQIYLKEKLLQKELLAPIAVVANSQESGIGSRDNIWQSIEGNLFLSFALPLYQLPSDLKIESASIYFAFILKETLKNFGSHVWMKWPNDFYINEKKAGGMITNIVGENLICGVGLNLIKAPVGFEKLDIEIKKSELLELYFKNIEKKFLWKQVFSKYKLEFYKNQNFFTHNNGVRVSLSDAILNDDGSLNINGERIYSLR